MQGAMAQHFQNVTVPSFSSPSEESGYSESSISADLITEVYDKFVQSSRMTESNQLCQGFTGKHRVYYKL